MLCGNGLFLCGSAQHTCIYHGHAPRAGRLLRRCCMWHRIRENVRSSQFFAKLVAWKIRVIFRSSRATFFEASRVSFSVQFGVNAVVYMSRACL